MSSQASDGKTRYDLLQLKLAGRQLDRLRNSHHLLIKAITEAIERLADTPRPAKAEKLAGRPEWRIRVGDYRILYLIDDRNKRITITAIGHRRDVYR